MGFVDARRNRDDITRDDGAHPRYFGSHTKSQTPFRDELPKIYSQYLINNLFRHPYIKIEFVRDDLRVSRITATKYLEELVRIGILSKVRKHRENFYLNDALFSLL